MEGRPALLLRRLNYDQHGRIWITISSTGATIACASKSIPTDFVGL